LDYFFLLNTFLSFSSALILKGKTDIHWLDFPMLLNACFGGLESISAHADVTSL